MKKLFIAAGLMSMICTAAVAQKKCVCPPKTNDKNKTTYTQTGVEVGGQKAENFKVCKDKKGYSICGQSKTKHNTTATSYNKNTTYVAPQRYPHRNDVAYNEYHYVQSNTNNDAPHSQSYPEHANVASFLNYSNSYDYDRKSNIVLDDGTTNATAPYEGESSPQYDGAARNKQRNLKVNSPEQNSTSPQFALPPSDGSGKKQ